MKTNEVAVILPKEVEQLAQGVSAEKRNEVQTTLDHVFRGVEKMRAQLDSVNVVDENDKVNMKLANTIRLGVRQVRLDAEKNFDSKRTEVQQAMQSFKTEDALWLKAKQVMQILTKDIEEVARWKEETKQRADAERKEAKTQERIATVAKFNTELTRNEFENMSDDSFALFLGGIEKQYNDKIEAEKKAEAERLAVIEADRLERERVLAENARLQKEAEEKRLRDEKRNKELSPFIVFIRDYSKMLNLSDADYAIEFLEVKKGAELQWELEAKEQIRKQAEAESQEKALKEERAEAARKAKEQADILAKQQAEAKRIQDLKDAENARLQAELKARQEAEAKALEEVEKAKEAARKEAAQLQKAPIKNKLTLWVDSFSIPEFEQHATADEIKAKFDSFKKWAKLEIEKIQ